MERAWGQFVAMICGANGISGTVHEARAPRHPVPQLAGSCYHFINRAVRVPGGYSLNTPHLVPNYLLPAWRRCLHITAA